VRLNISSEKYRRIWADVWKRLPLPVRRELDTWIDQVKDDEHYLGKRYGYANYEDIGRAIRLHADDLETLSETAIGGVIVHELGHAFCHMKCADPAPFQDDYDKGANCVSSAWGFDQELNALAQEKRPLEDA